MQRVFVAADHEGHLLASAPDLEDLVRKLQRTQLTSLALQPEANELLFSEPVGRAANPFDEMVVGAELPTAERAHAALNNLAIRMADVERMTEREAAAAFKQFQYPYPKTGKLPVMFLRDVDGDPGLDVDAIVRDFLRENYKTAKDTHISTADGRVTRVSVAGLNLVNAQTWKNVGPGIMPKGTNFCVGASAFCTAGCLIASGRAKTEYHYLKKLAAARLLMKEPVAFGRLLVSAVADHMNCPKSRFHTPLVRLNVFSDIPWELVFPELFDRFPDLMFYDYTKLVNRQEFPNYDLTFSDSGTNTELALEMLRQGWRCAIVFNLGKGQSLPRTWYGYDVIDGTQNDARPFDPQGVVVGLRYIVPSLKIGGKQVLGDVRQTAFVHMGVQHNDGTVTSPQVPSQVPSSRYTRETVSLFAPDVLHKLRTREKNLPTRDQHLQRRLMQIR